VGRYPAWRGAHRQLVNYIYKSAQYLEILIMKLNTATVAAAALIALGGVALGFYLGTRPGTQQTMATAPAPAPVAPAAPSATALPRVAAVPPGTATPAAHPPIPTATSGAATPSAAAPDANAGFTHFRVGNRNVKRIMADGRYVWVGTSGGVIRYDTESDNYRLFDIRSGLLANGIFHIGKLQGKVVVGTYGGGLAIHNDQDESWKIYNIPDGLGDAFIYDALEMDNGDIWIATWSGANRVRGGKLDDRSQWDLFTVANTDGGLPNDWVYGLAKGRDGELWMATEGGLTWFKDGEWRNWQHEDGLGAPYEQVKDQIQFQNDPAEFSRHHARQKTEMGLQRVDIAYNPNYIVSLQVDNDGTVWAGTWGGGLAHFDGEKWKNYTVADGLPANHVFALKLDQQGRLWIGTSKGLARRTDDGFKVYTTADGLFSENVFSLARAADGTFWVGSFGGVARLTRLD
jgi:ligand-binding sensor domain-containing protein